MLGVGLVVVHEAMVTASDGLSGFKQTQLCWTVDTDCSS